MTSCYIESRFGNKNKIGILKKINDRPSYPKVSIEASTLYCLKKNWLPDTKTKTQLNAYSCYNNLFLPYIIFLGKKMQKKVQNDIIF